MTSNGTLNSSGEPWLDLNQKGICKSTHSKTGSGLPDRTDLEIDEQSNISFNMEMEIGKESTEVPHSSSPHPSKLDHRLDSQQQEVPSSTENIVISDTQETALDHLNPSDKRQAQYPRNLTIQSWNFEAKDSCSEQSLFGCASVSNSPKAEEDASKNISNARRKDSSCAIC